MSYVGQTKFLLLLGMNVLGSNIKSYIKEDMECNVGLVSEFSYHKNHDLRKKLKY